MLLQNKSKPKAKNDSSLNLLKSTQKRGQELPSVSSNEHSISHRNSTKNLAEIVTTLGG